MKQIGHKVKRIGFGLGLLLAINGTEKQNAINTSMLLMEEIIQNKERFS